MQENKSSSLANWELETSSRNRRTTGAAFLLGGSTRSISFYHPSWLTYRTTENWLCERRTWTGAFSQMVARKIRPHWRSWFASGRHRSRMAHINETMWESGDCSQCHSELNRDYPSKAPPLHIWNKNMLWHAWQIDYIGPSWPQKVKNTYWWGWK